MRTLRSKFILWICVLFILMGAIILLPLSVMLPDKIAAQILKRDIKIGQYLSREAQEPLLVNNKLALKLLLEDRLENLPDAVYIFIRNPDGDIVSSTFDKGFPKGLLHMNDPAGGAYSVKEFLSAGRKVYDIAVPILEGGFGSLHLGVSLKSSRKEIAEFTKINYYVAAVIFTGLGVGIFVFTFLGIFLSNRIVKLRDFAVKIGHGDLEYKIDVETNDEIGALTVELNDMALALREKTKEINKLNIMKERERIALDLHDGVAQNLVSIIKRVELCEKLVKVDPEEALAELKVLKYKTKDIVNETRQLIFDIKSYEEERCGILERLRLYLKDYEKINNITVKMATAGSLDNIPAEKCSPIFYMITEALNNAGKHSLAKNVILDISEEKGLLKVAIKDDGRGFDVNLERASGPQCGKYGLAGMCRRAQALGGKVSVHSAANEGSVIGLEIPLI